MNDWNQYEKAYEAYWAPFEPVVPCRQFETRPCVDLTEDTTKRYRMTPCPKGKCRRFPTRDKEVKE